MTWAGTLAFSYCWTWAEASTLHGSWACKLSNWNLLCQLPLFSGPQPWTRTIPLTLLGDVSSLLTTNLGSSQSGFMGPWLWVDVVSSKDQDSLPLMNLLPVWVELLCSWGADVWGLVPFYVTLDTHFNLVSLLSKCWRGGREHTTWLTLTMNTLPVPRDILYKLGPPFWLSTLRPRRLPSNYYK